MLRKNLILLRTCGLLLTGLIVHSLRAAPDPDLFDGRVSAASPASKAPETPAADGDGGGQESSASSESQEPAGEARDLASIEGIAAGDSVQSQSSKASGGTVDSSNGSLPQAPVFDGADPSDGAGTTPGGGSQPKIGEQIGDYGTNVPSGL